MHARPEKQDALSSPDRFGDLRHDAGRINVDRHALSFGLVERSQS